MIIFRKIKAPFTTYSLHRKSWRFIASSLLCTVYALSIACSTYAEQGSVSIDSFNVIKTSPESVDIELIGSNDGTLGQICLETTSKSKDGSVLNNVFPSVVVPVGQKMHFPAQVIRPPGLDEQQTDFLIIRVSPCGKDIFLRHKFNWPFVWPKISEKSSSVPANDFAELNKFSSWWAFQENFEEEDFAALDALVEKWNTPKERDDDGDWKLGGFMVAFYFPPQTEDWRRSLQRIQKWRKFNPRSAGAAIIEARYWASYAKHIRGNENNQEVDPVSTRVFLKHMKLAEQILKKSKEFASHNPLWYETYLDIAIDTKRDDKFIANLIEEGIQKHPYYRSLYADLAHYWSPTNGNKADWEKIDALVKQAVTLTSGIDGVANYAWLYAQISSQQKVEVDILRESLVSWVKMRESFEDLVKRYPSANNLNKFAAFACRAGDKDAFLSVRPRIQSHIVLAMWPSNYSIDLCDHRFMQYS